MHHPNNEIDIENNIDSDHNKDASHGDLSEDESNERYDYKSYQVVKTRVKYFCYAKESKQYHGNQKSFKQELHYISLFQCLNISSLKK